MENKKIETLNKLYKSLTDDEKNKFLYKNNLICSNFVDEMIQGSDLALYKCKKCHIIHLYDIRFDSTDIVCYECNDFVCITCDKINVNQKIINFEIQQEELLLCNNCRKCYYCNNNMNNFYNLGSNRFVLCCFDCLASFDHIKKGMFWAKKYITELIKHQRLSLKDLTLCSIYYNKLNYKHLFKKYPLLFDTKISLI